MTKKKSEPEKIRARIIQIEQWIMENHPEVMVELKQQIVGSEERAYYMFGYMMALKDVIEILKRMGIKWTID